MVPACPLYRGSTVPVSRCSWSIDGEGPSSVQRTLSLPVTLLPPALDRQERAGEKEKKRERERG